MVEPVITYHSVTLRSMYITDPAYHQHNDSRNLKHSSLLSTEEGPVLYLQYGYSAMTYGTILVGGFETIALYSKI